MTQVISVASSFVVDRGEISVEPLNGDFKAGEHPLWFILLGPGSIPGREVALLI